MYMYMYLYYWTSKVVQYICLVWADSSLADNLYNLSPPPLLLHHHLHHHHHHRPHHLHHHHLPPHHPPHPHHYHLAAHLLDTYLFCLIVSLVLESDHAFS